MTKEQALRIFKEEELPYIQEKYPYDRVAIRTAWNDFTDYLCKDGQITEHQYETWDNPF